MGAVVNVTDRANIAYWYPKLYGLPTPRTLIVTTDVDLLSVLDGEQPEGWGAFKQTMAAAAGALGMPCFLRTGWLSGKHSWKQTCFLLDLDDLAAHIVRLVEESALGGIMGLPHHTWAVRELIATDPAFLAFRGRMPIACEQRWFVADGEVVGHHPYWPADAIVDPSVKNWRDRLEQLDRSFTYDDVGTLRGLSEQVAQRFSGAWSVDYLRSSDGRWLLIDMAPAERSWCWHDHPDAPKPELLEAP